MVKSLSISASAPQSGQLPQQGDRADVGVALQRRRGDLVTRNCNASLRIWLRPPGKWWYTDPRGGTPAGEHGIDGHPGRAAVRSRLAACHQHGGPRLPRSRGGHATCEGRKRHPRGANERIGREEVPTFLGPPA